MLTKRTIVSKLPTKYLQECVNYFDLEVGDKRKKAHLVDVLVDCDEAPLDEILGDGDEWYRDDLKALCRSLGIDDSGTRKGDLIARIIASAEESAHDDAPETEPRRESARTRTKPGKTTRRASANGATTGYENELWNAANALRGTMDAAEYKHVVLGLIFLKYISDAFEEHYAVLDGQRYEGVDPEDRDEYTADNVFWVPKAARWTHLKGQARQPTIGTTVDDAMSAIERENQSLKGVLPKDYARPGLDKQRLGQLIDLVSNIQVGDSEGRSRDVLGRIYEYFLSQFASAEGKKGGEFYTPRCVVKLLVEMLRPYRGRVYDPCCGSSGMFVQSMEFIRAHATGNGNGPRGAMGAEPDIRILGQESNYTTWRLAKMNLAIRGINGDIKHGDTLQNDLHPDLKLVFDSVCGYGEVQI